MDIFKAYMWTREQYLRWVGSNTAYDVHNLQSVILRELRFRRKFPKSISAGLLIEISEEFRMVSAILKAYPHINQYHAWLSSIH